ncbi:Bacteriocin class II with double-glycine leader peptide [Streptococcus equinus]|uniref:Blp family class II bacteriocin n=1 Tax=Streptococcus equinus TaxID=1335 RepID=UPI000886D6D5|nr:Blp family class II bacteriocin [Streptococcus equinus]SDQ02953.1 Bacteriocin class II with double-glycine leader peptide [Streptococcus equinus]
MKNLEQFAAMTEAELSTVEGGKKCNYSQVIFDGFMGAAGNVPGIVIGGIGGAVLSYGGYCL